MKTCRTILKENHDYTKLSTYLKEEIVLLLGLSITGLIFNIGISFCPKIFGHLLDQVILECSTKDLLQWCLIYFVFVFWIQMNRFLKRYFVRLFANRTMRKMRLVYFEHLLQKDSFSFDEKGSVLTLSIGDVNESVEGLRKFLTEIFDTMVLMITYLVSLMVYQVFYSLLACMFIPAALLIAFFLRKKVYNANHEYRKELGIYSSSLYDYLTHASLYREYDGVISKEQNLKNSLNILENKAILANILDFSLQPVYLLVSSIGVVIILYFGFKQVITQNWTVGDYTSYLAIYIAFTKKASRVSKLVNSVQKGKVSWTRLSKFLVQHQTKEIEEKSIQELKLVLPLTNTVQETLIINKGTTLGLAGKIASGKTYWLKQILGSIPTKDQIFLNGKALEKYCDEEKKAFFSPSFHEPFLTSFTVEENICFGKKKDDCLFQKVVDICDLQKDFDSLPQKEFTLLGSKIRLSGGQQARLSLARALYLDRSCLILDDPFSSLDVMTKEKVSKALFHYLKEERPNTILILVTNELSIFDSFDQVVFFDDTMRYVGTMDSLMKTCPTFKMILDWQKGEKHD